MKQVTEIRPHMRFKVGQMVSIGTSDAAFKIERVGHCAPSSFMKNPEEFMQLAVPGSPYGIFNVHINFLKIREEV